MRWLAGTVLVCLIGLGWVGAERSAAPLLDVLERLEARPDLKIKYYLVEGNSLAEARQSIMNEGKRRDAYLAWEIFWTDPVEALASGTALVKPAVRNQMELTLPRWQNPPADLAGQWERYLLAVIEHELVHIGHVDTAVEALKKDLLDASTVDGMVARQQADMIGHKALNAIRAEDRAFDRRTKHGATQGAVL